MGKIIFFILIDFPKTSYLFYNAISIYQKPIFTINLFNFRKWTCD